MPHVYNLIFQKHQKKPLDAIFFPMIDTLHQPLKQWSRSNACPTVTATPNAVKAAFTKESDVFKENGIEYLDPILNLRRPEAIGPCRCSRRGGRSSASPKKRTSARSRLDTKPFEASSGWAYVPAASADSLERENRLGIVMLGCVYGTMIPASTTRSWRSSEAWISVFSQSFLPNDVLYSLP